MMPITKENAMPSLIPRASMSNMHDRLKLKSSRERLSSTSPRSSPTSKGARRPTKSPLSPLKGSLPRTFVKSFAALAVENQNVRRTEVDNAPAFTQIFEKWSPTIPKAPKLRTEQRALKRSQSPDKMGVEPSRQLPSGRPRVHATDFDDRFLSQRHPRPSWLPLLQEYLEYVEHRRNDPARRMQPMLRGDYVAYLLEQARLWDAFQAAVQEYIGSRPADVRNLMRGEWALFNIEEPEDAQPDDQQQAAWRRFMLHGLNMDDFVPQTVRQHRDRHERALNRAIYEFVEDDSQNCRGVPARSPAPTRSPAPARSAHSSAAYPWQPPRLLTPSASSAARSSEYLYMRADAHRTSRPAEAVRLHSESVPNLRRPQTQREDNLKSARTSPEKEGPPKAQRDERPRQAKQTPRPRKDSDNGDHYAQKQQTHPRRKDDDDDQDLGGYRGGPTWGKDSSSNDKMQTFQASHPRYNGINQYGPHGRYYGGYSRGTKEHTNASGLNGSAAPFIPQNGRFEQLLPREQLVRSVNWHKEEGKIPCGFSERAKFNQGGYRAGVIAV